MTGHGSDLSNPGNALKALPPQQPCPGDTDGSALPFDSKQHRSSTWRESRPRTNEPALTDCRYVCFLPILTLCTGVNTVCALHVWSAAPNTKLSSPLTQGKLLPQPTHRGLPGIPPCCPQPLSMRVGRGKASEAAVSSRRNPCAQCHPPCHQKALLGCPTP